MADHVFAANSFPAADRGIDSYLLQVTRQSELSRKLWLFVSLTIIAGVGVFIAMQ